MPAGTPSCMSLALMSRPRNLLLSCQVAKVVPAAKCLIVAPDVRISPIAHINPVAALQVRGGALAVPCI